MRDDYAKPMLKRQQTALRVEGRLAVWHGASLPVLRQGCNERFHNSLAHCWPLWDTVEVTASADRHGDWLADLL